MNQRPMTQPGRTLSIAIVVLLAVTGATAQRQVHPPGPDTLEPPVVIAVLSDNYTKDQAQEFDFDVANFFNHGLLVDEGYFEDKAKEMRVVTFFRPVAAPGQTLYDFRIGFSPQSPCAVQTGTQTYTKIREVVEDLDPTHTVIIGNHPYNIGCSDEDWTYVAVDAVGTDVLPHELGHSIGDLYDEWAPIPGRPGPFQHVVDAQLNCSDTRANAPWKNDTPPPAIVDAMGCGLFRQLIHGYHDCRMGATHSHHFCKVCKRNMDEAFDSFRFIDQRGSGPGGPNPNQAVVRERPQFGFVNAAFMLQQPTKPEQPGKVEIPSAPRPVYQLVVSFNPTTNALQVVRRNYAPSVRYVPSYRRGAGRYVYEFVDTASNQTVEVGVLSEHAFETRSYRGAAPQHPATEVDAGEVVLRLPVANEDEIQKRSFSLVLWDLATLPKMDPTPRTITPAVWQDLRSKKLAGEPRATLSPEVVRGATGK